MSDPDDRPSLPSRVVLAAFAAITGDYSRPADTCHADARPTRPPPAPNSPDDTQPQPEETDPC